MSHRVRCTCEPWAPDEDCPTHGEGGILEQAAADRMIPALPPLDSPVVPDPWGVTADGPAPF